MNSRPTRSGSRSSRQAFDFSALEDRRLLAVSVAFDSDTGVVSLFSNAESDIVYVVNNGSDTQIQYNGNQAANFSNTNLNQIKFFGGAGDDFLQNDTNIRTLFVGHAGNDTFYGGSNDDVAYAVDGDDVLFGGAGNDVLDGGNGNDQLSGDDGDDTLNGGFDDDTILGGAGDDYVNAGFGDDTIYGGAGDDLVNGASGNDTIYGNDGNDGVYGQAGDDTIYGNDGNDRVRGNNDNDLLFGGNGSDHVMTDNGDDVAHGDGGVDFMYGYFGDDVLYGGDAGDHIFGQDGNDVIYGGDGDDFITGSVGDDIIYGDAGADRIFGNEDVDHIYGGSGADNLFGGDGDDSLFGGGLTDADQIYGNQGQDRFLAQDADNIIDHNPNDARINFVDADDVWTAREIEVIADALTQLHDVTNNNTLLRDSLSTEDLTLYKYQSLGGAAGINYLYSSWYSDSSGTTYEYDREIHIADWDETSDWYNDQFRSVAIHEIGHNWGSELEMTTVSSELAGVWDQFVSLSGWTDSNPSSSSFTQSHDGQWWFDNSAVFADNYGKTNPQEDFSTVWESYFDNIDTPEEIPTGLSEKITSLESMFAALTS